MIHWIDDCINCIEFSFAEALQILKTTDYQFAPNRRGPPSTSPGEVDYNDGSITENTRVWCAKPRLKGEISNLGCYGQTYGGYPKILG